MADVVPLALSAAVGSVPHVESMETAAIISQFIRHEMPHAGDEDLIVPDAPLVSTGILDSISVLKLLVFIEERFEVKITDEELRPANFDTINRIATFVEAKIRTRA